MSEQPSMTFFGPLGRAYRRACRSGIAEIGTDLVLCYTALHVRCVEGTLPYSWEKVWRPVRKGQAGLTDPDPPVRKRPGTPDGGAALRVDGVLREAAVNELRSMLARRYRRKDPLPLPAFSPAVRYAVYEAMEEAARAGVQHARAEHLLVGLLALPDSAACRLLSQWRIAEPDSLDRIVRADRAFSSEDEPQPNRAVTQLAFWQVLPASEQRRWPWRALMWLVWRDIRRRYHRHGACYGHPILNLIQTDAARQALYTGHAFVTAAHVLLSLIDLHEHLESADMALPDDAARWSQAGAILAAHGVRGDAATKAATRLASAPNDKEELLAGLPTRGWRPPRNELGAPTQGRTALAALRDASLSAHRLGHPYAGTTHLLGALLAQPDGPAVRLLRQLGVDPDDVRLKVTRHLNNRGYS
ncbi:hypothetical protein GCM10023322_70990 [Rugosimonospora acidiphila]|uniref:Clp R domain-containing protein n=1 Tax=Rugosimonospora acidiphila TaxID=556531 RepID=A0ABP9SLN1_9ACTN